jgi:hypothetical protein
MEYLHRNGQIPSAVHIPDRATASPRMSLSESEDQSRFPRFAMDTQFIVGQDEQGHWLALEANGLRGGIFVDRGAAWRFARTETRQCPDAVRFSKTPLTLWAKSIDPPGSDERQKLKPLASRQTSGRFSNFLQRSPKLATNRRRLQPFLVWWRRLPRRLKSALSSLRTRRLSSGRALRAGGVK